MRRLLILLCLFLLPFSLHAQTADSTLPNGVASGDTSQTSTVLWTRSTEIGMVTFEVLEGESVVQTLTADVTDPTIPVKVVVENLSPDTAYTYRVTDAAGTSLTGQFRTAADIGTRRGLRFGVTGDWRGEIAPYAAIQNVPERALDFMVLHGDTIYADVPSVDVPIEQAQTIEEYRAKHMEVYGERYGVNVWAEVRATTSVFVTIDDHEVTNDFSGGAAVSSDARFADENVEFINDTVLYETGMQVFQEYNPIRDMFYGETGDPVTEGERQLYRTQTFGSDAAIFLLDARSFRSLPIEAPEDFGNLAAVLGYLNELNAEGRTMLGTVQFEDLKRDLAQAQAEGVTWKFILVPEPAQNMGVLAASDRYEGYAAERRALLQFIETEGITNVVFIAADIHGTLVNNLGYQEAPFQPTVALPIFEITRGSVGYYQPFGQTVMGIGVELGLVDEATFAEYEVADAAGKEVILKGLIDSQLTTLGYSPIGLEDSGLNVELITGSYMATHTYGWTEFEIDAETQALRVITYGIQPYSAEEVAANPDEILSREPQILMEFVVQPQ